MGKKKKKTRKKIILHSVGGIIFEGKRTFYIESIKVSIFITSVVLQFIIIVKYLSHLLTGSKRNRHYILNNAKKVLLLSCQHYAVSARRKSNRLICLYFNFLKVIKLLKLYNDWTESVGIEQFDRKLGKRSRSPRHSWLQTISKESRLSSEGGDVLTGGWFWRRRVFLTSYPGTNH